MISCDTCLSLSDLDICFFNFVPGRDGSVEAGRGKGEGVGTYIAWLLLVDSFVCSTIKMQIMVQRRVFSYLSD